MTAGFVEVSLDSVSADDPGTAFKNACVKGNPFLRKIGDTNLFAGSPGRPFHLSRIFSRSH